MCCVNPGNCKEKFRKGGVPVLSIVFVRSNPVKRLSTAPNFTLEPIAAALYVFEVCGDSLLLSRRLQLSSVLIEAPMQFDYNKSLQELDGQDWGEPTFDSHLITECHRLHRIPLQDFTVEDLRIMIGQDIGSEYLIPMALERLRADPFAEDACYTCDLLVNVLRAETRFWQGHPELRDQLVAIADRVISLFPTMPDIGYETVVEAVTTAYEKFKRKNRPGA